MFMTGTRVENETKETQRVKDGLIISEYHFRNYEPLKLFEETRDISDLFTTSKKGSLEGLAYTDSSILTTNDPTQQAWNRTTIFTDRMTFTKSEDMVRQDPGYGVEWIDDFALCESNGINYKTLGTRGMSYKQLVSYMTPDESSKANCLKNDRYFIDNKLEDVFTIWNNLDVMMDEVYFDLCKKDAICAGTFSLCYQTERSAIFECDADSKASSKEWRPKESQMVTDYDLVGEAWKFEITTDEMPCYLASLIVKRIDGKESLLQHSQITKRIFVADVGEPPYLLKKPNIELYAQAGEDRVLSFSNITDPEGKELIFNVNLREAAKFARWDEEQLAIIIEKNTTVFEKDAGVYPIELELIEVIRGVRMPAYSILLNLTIGFYPPVPEPVVKVVIPEPKNLPRPQIFKFLMNGKM